MTTGSDIRSDLAALGRRNRKIRADAQKLRDEVVPKILQASLEGLQQKEIAELTGYTRESIRQICKYHTAKEV